MSDILTPKQFEQRINDLVEESLDDLCDGGFEYACVIIPKDKRRYMQEEAHLPCAILKNITDKQCGYLLAQASETVGKNRGGHPPKVEANVDRDGNFTAPEFEHDIQPKDVTEEFVNEFAAQDKNNEQHKGSWWNYDIEK